MCKREPVLAAVVAAVALAAMLLLIGDHALARGGSFGGRGLAPHGPAGFHGRSFGHRPLLRHGHVRGRHTVSANDLRRGLYAWPWLSGAGVVYGGAPDIVDGSSAIPSAPSLAVRRPACRLQSQTMLVARSDGGEREIVVTRCLVPPDATASPPDAGSARDDLTGSVPAGPDAAAAGAFARTDTVNLAPFDSPACRVQSRVVPTEDGGERVVRLHRC